jgi:hypothetical protein
MEGTTALMMEKRITGFCRKTLTHCPLFKFTFVLNVALSFRKLLVLKSICLLSFVCFFASV